MGTEVDDGTFWIETHKRKDGSWVNEEAANIGVSN